IFIGLLADRLFSTEKVLAVLHLVGALFLAWGAYIASQGFPEVKAAFETAAKEQKIGEGTLLDALAEQTKLQEEVNKASDSAKADAEKKLKAFNEKNDKAIQDAVKRVNESASVSGTVSSLFTKFLWIMIAYALCYMPTLTLTNSISFRNLSDPDKQFGSIRVLGTIGWIVAGLVVGFLVNATSPQPLYLAAGASILLGLFSLALPHTPPSGGAKTLG